MNYRSTLCLLLLGCTFTGALQACAGADHSDAVQAAAVSESLSPVLARAAANAVTGVQQFSSADRLGSTGRALMARVGPWRRLTTNATAQQDVQNYLSTNVFTQANVKSHSGNTTVYALQGATLCGADSDPSCASTVDALAIILTAKQVANGYDLTVGMGSPAFSPATLSVRQAPESVSVDFDLGSLPQLTTLLDSVTGSQNSAQDIGTSQGHLVIKSSIDDANNVTDTLEVAEAIKVVSSDQSNSLQIAASTDTFSLGSQGQTWTSSANLGAVDVTTPFGGNGNSSMQVHLDGLTYTAAADSNMATPVIITDLSLGQHSSTVSMNGNQVVQLDLNADANRQVNVQIQPATAQGATSVQLSTPFKAAVSWNFTADQQDFPAIPSQELVDTLTIDLENNGGTAVVQPQVADMMGINQDALAVQQGTLNVSTNSGKVTVPAGQCFEGVDSTDDGDSIINEYTAGSCQ